MGREYIIGLNSWIIQDGNYPDISVGDQRDFALEFYATYQMKTADVQGQTALDTLDRPSINGVVKTVFADKDVWIIDFGIMAYCTQPIPLDAKVGDLYEISAYIGVDPFDYFERLNRKPGVPPLIYSWKIDAIQLETTPWIEKADARGRTIKMRDESRFSCKSVDRTSAWDHDEGSAEYALHCTLLDRQPRKEK
jgi:hypothetical protein